MRDDALLYGKVIARPFPEEDGQGLVRHLLPKDIKPHSDLVI